MEYLNNNKFKIIAIVVALAGIPVGIAMVNPDERFFNVAFGIMAAFFAIGFFIWFLDLKYKKNRKFAAVVIWLTGLLAGFLIGYRLLGYPLSPWRWDRYDYYFMPMVVYMPMVYRPMDWICAIIPWSIFFVLGAIIWFKGDKKAPFFKNNILKLIAVAVTLLGVPVGIAFIDPYYDGVWVIIMGIALGFALVGLFVYFLNPKIKTKYKRIASIIIWLLGIISGLLIGYRHGATPAQPWRWFFGSGWLQVYVGPHIDWSAALVPWIIFFLLGAILWVGLQRNKSLK